MSGRRIDDHNAWMGARGKDMPLPMESKMKQYSSDGHSGAMHDYPDTSERIESDQGKGSAKIKGRPLKSGYRY